MADSFYIDMSGVLRISDKIKSMEKTLVGAVDNVLDANTVEIATKAKTLAPKDLGGLASSISADNSKLLEKHIAVNANYAAYVEFGTGKYAAQYVGSLPSNWSQYAAQFRGKTGKSGLFEAILKWVKSKGLHGVTASGRRRTGKKAEEDIYNIAYVITVNILRNGIHAHPFLFPAYEQQRGQIIKDIETVLKTLA